METACEDRTILSLLAGHVAALSSSDSNQRIRLFHVEPPGGFRDGRVDVRRHYGAEPFLCRR